jgi:hypothetical protein
MPIVNTDPVPPARERVQPDKLHDQLITVLDYPYSGHDETAALLSGALRAALEVAKRHEHGALRWEDQLQVPEWIAELRREIADALGMPR